MMKKISCFILYLFSVVALSWFLPWIVGLAFPGEGGEPFAAFSPISNEWVLSKATEDRNTEIYSPGISGGKGVSYTKSQRDSLLPQMYYKDLMAREKIPESIAGKAVTVPALRHGEIVFTSNPRDVNKRMPEIFLMMESMPSRADLEDPSEVFRMDGKMEFINMADNKINRPRSDRFNEVLLQRGFSFPMKDCNANITSRKLRDEGYLMVDAKGKAYHVKQRGGRPYVAKVNFPDTVVVEKVFIFENPDESLLGMAADDANDLYFILRDGYKAVKLPVGKADPTKERINVIGNMFNVVFRIASDEKTRWVAVDRDSFNLLGEYDYVRERSLGKSVKAYLFPYQLDFNSTKDQFVFPRLSNWSWGVIYFNVVLAAIIFVYYRRQRRSYKWAMPLLTLFFGIYLFIPALLIRE